ncbi:MAG: hypothetical protein Kow0065_13660 [Methylomicrobium sp.]
MLGLLTLAWLIDQRYHNRLIDHFDFETQRITSIIGERMALHGLTLRAAAGLFSGSDEVTRNDWREFIGMLELDQNYPGVQGVGFSLWIPAEQLDTHIAHIRQQSFPDYVVKPTEKRPFYTSIVYLEPFYGRNLRAFGYDMFSEPIRRQAMERARDNGELAYSGKVTLLQETRTDIQAGMLAYFPVYRNGTIPQTVEQRRAALIGWVYSAYRMNDLLSAILGKKLYALRLEIFDADRLNRDGLLYDSHSAPIPPDIKPDRQALTQTQRLDLGGHYWTLRYTALPEFNKTTQFEAPWIEFSTLGFIGLLLFFITWSYISARRNEAIAKNLSESLQQSENRFRNLFEYFPVAYIALDQQGRLLDVNQQFCELLEYGGQELLGKKLFELIECNDEQDFELKLQMLNYYGFLECELSLIRKSGNSVTVILDGRLQNNGQKKNVIHCILTNITERKRAEDRLQLAARVFSEAQEGISITDANGTILDVNPTFCAMTGYRREELIGQNHRILHSGKHDDAFYHHLWKTLQSQGHWQGEIWNVKKNGERYAERLTISAMRNTKGEIVNYLGLCSDITQSILQQQTLEKMAHYDPLTQLPNRILFTDRFNQALAHCKRDNSLLAVVYMDLDGFKQVNDQLGHEAGDQLLIQVAARLKDDLREEDTVSRLGGDEFALLLNGIETQQQCAHTLQRIHQSIARPYSINGQTVSIGASSGVTLYPKDHSDPDFLLRHADHAMYRAKQKGRNRFEFFDANDKP